MIAFFRENLRDDSIFLLIDDLINKQNQVKKDAFA